MQKSVWYRNVKTESLTKEKNLVKELSQGFLSRINCQSAEQKPKLVSLLECNTVYS